MIRNVICSFCLFFILSCKSVDLNYPDYANQDGYKSLYVVDTIQIDDPVSVLTKSGYCFVMSHQAFNSFNGKEKTLFKRADVFLLELRLPIYIPGELYNKYILSNSYSYLDNRIPLKSDKKKIKELMSFGRQPDFFLLVLIRGDFYNRVYTGLDGPPTLELENEKFSYYKVAIPYGVAN